VERKAFFGSLLERAVFAAKNLGKAALDFFGNPSIAA
jgi:hypothetical protein